MSKYMIQAVVLLTLLAEAIKESGASRFTKAD
jgi:hypothetical protein